MSMRIFRSSSGDEWHVWSVIPGRRDSERRRGYDRRSPDPVFAYRGHERRTPSERRKPALVSPALAAGWLVFEGPGERRRLYPVPPAWDSCPDTELERMCSRAQPVGAQRRSGSEL